MHRTTAVSIIAALSAASAGMAGLTSLAGTGIVAEGSYLSPTFAPSAWSVRFDFDGDLTGAATDADFGNWTFSVSNGAMQWSASGSGVSSGRWSTAGSSRIFTVELGPGSSAGSGSLSPAPTSISVIYTAVRASGSWGTLGQALLGSQGPSLNPSLGGFIVRDDAGGVSTGRISSGYQLVPGPGATALLGAAVAVARRRRR